MADYTTMTEEELRAEQAAIDAEIVKRYNLESIPQQMAALNESYLGAEGTVEGEAWRQPTGAHDAYPLAWVVAHVGKQWESLVASNVWEPGVSGWAEYGVDWPAWVQPTGAHDAYAVGAQVTHNGLNWTSDVDANTWEPGVYGWTEAQP